MKQKIKNLLLNIIILVCLAVAAFSAWKLYGYYKGYRDGEEEYEELARYVQRVEDDEKEDTKKGEKSVCPITVDFSSLQAVNEDIVAWIYIENTGINYPVVQGEDNEYYLHHTFEKKDNFSGAIFMDVSCNPDFSSDNSILFGHNLKNGEMFGPLKKTYDTEYNKDADWKSHSDLWVVTPEAAMQYRLFAAREISVNRDMDVYMIDFSLEEEYRQWVQQQKEASLYETDTDITSGEPMLTLSTCTSDNDDGRFIVQAIRVQVCK